MVIGQGGLFPFFFFLQSIHGEPRAKGNDENGGYLSEKKKSYHSGISLVWNGVSTKHNNEFVSQGDVLNHSRLYHT